MQQMSTCDSWAPQPESGEALCNVPAAALCWAIGLYTICKVPFYLFAQLPQHGLEVGVLLGCATSAQRHTTRLDACLAADDSWLPPSVRTVV